MNMKFSSKYILVSFDEGEIFAGLSVRMGGEPLTNAYLASLSTMEWIENHKTYPTDEFVRRKVFELIERDNAQQTYKVLFMEE